MTVKIINVPYSTYRIGDIVTLDSDTESSLIVSGRAETVSAEATLPIGGNTGASVQKELVRSRFQKGYGKLCVFGDSIAQYNHTFASPTSLQRLNNVVTGGGALSLSSGQLLKISSARPISFNTNKVQMMRLGPLAFSYPSVGPNEKATTTGSAVQLAFLSNCGQFVYVNGILNGALDLVYNFGQGGERSDQIAARLAEVVAVSPTGTNECNEVWIYAGTNDASAGITAVEVAKSYTKIVTSLVDAGYAVRFMTVQPFGAGLAAIATVMPLVKQYNEWILRNADRYGYIVSDVFSVMTDSADANGAALTSYLQTDNTHPTELGALAAGTKTAATYPASVSAASSVLTTSQNDGYATSPLLPNIWTSAPWANTGGTISDVVSGTAGAGLNVSSSGNAGRTAVASVVTANTGLGFAQQVVFTAAANNDTCTIQQNSGATMAARVLPGERYRFKFYLKLTNVAGASLKYVRNRIQGAFDGVSSIQIGSAISLQDQTVSYAADATYTIVSPEIVIPTFAACTSLTSEIIFNFSAVGTALTIQVERISMDRVMAQ